MKRFLILCLAASGCTSEPVLPPAPSVQEQKSALDEQPQASEPSFPDLAWSDLDWIDRLVEEMGGEELVAAKAAAMHFCIEKSTGLKFTGDFPEESSGTAWMVRARALGGNEHTRKCDAVVGAMTEDEVMAVADHLAKDAQR